MMTFGDWLKNELDKRDWTQADLARRSGLQRATISRYIADLTHTPDPEAINRIAAALTLHPETVYQAAGLLPPSIEAADIKAILWKLAEIAPERRDLVIAMIDAALTAALDQGGTTT